MDINTGKEIATVDNLGLGLAAGTSVITATKDILGYNYSNVVTTLTLSSTQDSNFASTNLILQTGDINNTTTTGRQAVVFWYSKANSTQIDTNDSSIYVEDTWSGELGFVGAKDKNGVALSYQQFIVAVGTVGTAALNADVPGRYTVSYSLGGCQRRPSHSKSHTNSSKCS